MVEPSSASLIRRSTRRQRRKANPQKNVPPKKAKQTPRKRKQPKRRKADISITNSKFVHSTDSVGNPATGMHNTSYIEDTFSVRKEKVANILSSVHFNRQTSLVINPGNSLMFPVFAPIAANYEQYRVNYLRFYFESEAYTAIAGATALGSGKVILGTLYDPNAPLWVSDTEAEDYYNSNKNAPFKRIVHDVLSRPKGAPHYRGQDWYGKNYYVNYGRNYYVPPGQSQDVAKFYDLGIFNLITQGQLNNVSEIGELYVEYSFTMIRPKREDTIGATIPATHASSTGNFASALTPFPANTTIDGGATLPITLTSNGFLFPYGLLGRYLVTISWVCNAPQITSPASLSGVNLTYVSYWNGDAQTTVGGNYGAAAPPYPSDIINVIVDLTLPLNQAGLSVTGGLAGMLNGNVDLVVVQLPSGLNLNGEKKRNEYFYKTPVDRTNTVLYERILDLERKFALTEISSTLSTPIHIEQKEDSDPPRYPVGSINPGPPIGAILDDDLTRSQVSGLSKLFGRMTATYKDGSSSELR